MKGHITLIFLLLVLVTFAGEIRGEQLKKDCRTESCTTTYAGYDGGMLSFTRFWIYQGGKLVIDSLNAHDTLVAYTFHTAHYAYSGDSVIRSNKPFGSMVIKLNDKGLPVRCTMPYGIEYGAFYKQDGTLEKASSARAVVNEKGLLDSYVTTIDSIIYSDGNVMSYRVSNPQVSFSVYLTYYTDKLYNQDIDPTERLMALCEGDGGDISLKPQAFSKNLIKTKVLSSTDSYEYQFNDKGQIISIDKTSTSEWQPTPHTVHNVFRYLCE